METKVTRMVEQLVSENGVDLRKFSNSFFECLGHMKNLLPDDFEKQYLFEYYEDTLCDLVRTLVRDNDTLVTTIKQIHSITNF